MPEPVRVDVVRVFADDSDAFGTELGIVVASEDTDGRERALVSESRLAAAVFVGDVIEGIAEVRVFTTTAELNFAGVAAVGAGWWFAHVGAPVTAVTLPVGRVTVHLEGAMTWITAHARWMPELVTPSGASAEPSGAVDELIDIGGQVEFERTFAV
jgi:predicted PhzF superfamily epimerase YddE/YHI9